MERNKIRVGMCVDFGGYIAEVLEILPEGIVIECEEIGEDIVSPANLKPVRISAYDEEFYRY